MSPALREPFKPISTGVPAPASALGRHRAEHDLAPRPPEAQVEAPDVHITIGRIEIRAVPPPTASGGNRRPERAAAGRPGAALEEYLRRRGARSGGPGPFAGGGGGGA
jgi:hypothetical protein